MRSHLFARLGLTSTKRVIEVGCGTGVITKDLSNRYSAAVHGADLSLDFLRNAHSIDQRTDYSCADVFALPYPDETFDAIVCHFFLLWISNLPAALSEMRRVTKKAGFILALAEPDYAGRIDYPDSLRELGQWQSLALKKQGANPEIGRRLMSEFINSGLHEVESGLLGGQWRTTYNPDAFESEWKVLESDLNTFVPASTLKTLRQIDQASHMKGERILFIPTFYAIGIKPGE